MVNYYYHHIPTLSEITAPLNELSGGPKATNRKPLKTKFISNESIQ